MLVYFKNRHGNLVEINIEPQETMEEVVMKVEELGGIEKVTITMIKHSCKCNNDLTSLLLDDISNDISIELQNEVDINLEINQI